MFQTVYPRECPILGFLKRSNPQLSLTLIYMEQKGGEGDLNSLTEKDANFLFAFPSLLWKRNR
jgi:hypothetical protein